MMQEPVKVQAGEENSFGILDASLIEKTLLRDTNSSELLEEKRVRNTAIGRRRKKRHSWERELCTKNLLRNFAVAQNSFILHNIKARHVIEKTMPDPEHFYQWVYSLNLRNFVDYRRVWEEVSDPFCQLYRYLCWIFYSYHAIPYIFNSRLKQSQHAHLAFISKFIQGLRHPDSFRKFK